MTSCGFGRLLGVNWNQTYYAYLKVYKTVVQHRIEQSGVASTKKKQLRKVTETLSPKTGNRKPEKNYCLETISNELLRGGGGVVGADTNYQAESRPQFMRWYKTFS